MARSVRVSSVRWLVNVMLVAPLLEFSLSVFGFCPTVCCDGFVIRCCLLCFVSVDTVRGSLV